MSPLDISFIDTDFQNGDFRVTDTDAYGAPDADVKIVELARTDGNVQLLDRLKGRTINVKGYMSTSTTSGLRNAMDVLNGLLLKTGPLRVTEDGAYREWDAKCANVNIARASREITRASYSMQFVSQDPYAVDGNTDTLVSQAHVTAATNSYNISVPGTYPAYMDTTLFFNNIVPDSTNIEIYIQNPSTSQTLTIVDTFEIGDTLTIDTRRRLVFHNSTLISPEGDFPIWLPGAGTFSFSDNGITRDIALTGLNNRRWL